MASSNSTTRVAIIGRPNVGKSTLFNILSRKRRAVVRNEPGVTRDILIEPAEWWGHKFDIADTGGMTDSEDTISKLIKESVVATIKSFDLLVVVMDGKSGLTPEDRDLYRIAKESGRPFLLVVNKVDQMHTADMILSEFYEFGDEVLACSFERRDNIDDLVEWIIANSKREENTFRKGVRLTVVGKPNVGKSSLCNRLLGQKRMLVSDIAGTTVDAVEAEFKWGGEKYILVDTAGLRKQAKRKDGVEYLSAIKSHNSIAKADVVVLMVDAVEGPTVQDSHVIEYILERHKAVIVAANKCDLAKEEVEAYRLSFRERAAEQFHFFRDIPIVFISAKTGFGLHDLFNKVEDIWAKLHMKIPTSKLNKFFYETIREAPAPVYGTKNVKFYYLTQTEQVPPSFIAFANHPNGVTPSYRRFLSKRIQSEWELKGIPVRMFIMRGK